MKRLDFAATLLGVLAAGVWLGGLLVLGALVAPIVFHVVPAPASGDAMALVFRRFDRAALACAAVLGLVEAARARASAPDYPRIACVAIAAISALILALKITPEIADLHASGAIRGVGALGEALDRAHDWATRLGKLEALALLLIIGLHLRKR